MISDELFAIHTVTVPLPTGHQLYWRDDVGMGFLPPVKAIAYDQAYWDKYQEYAHSDNGEAINDARKKFVNKHCPLTSSICDVGIGNGQFLKSMDYALGYDVNEAAVKWLKEVHRYADPYLERFEVLTFWDVLEHIEDPTKILNSKHVFVSLPIHESLDACVNSKHLRPGEHLWHFTTQGFITFMNVFGYTLVEMNDHETTAGRESIKSFYFTRRV